MRTANKRFKGSALALVAAVSLALSACGGQDTTYSCADVTITMDDTARNTTFQTRLTKESGNTYSFYKYASGLRFTAVVSIAPDGTITGDGVRYIDKKNENTDDFTVTGIASLPHC